MQSLMPDGCGVNLINIHLFCSFQSILKAKASRKVSFKTPVVAVGMPPSQEEDNPDRIMFSSQKGQLHSCLTKKKKKPQCDKKTIGQGE